MIKQAEHCYMAGRYAEAADLVRALAGACDPDALGLLGLCQLRLGDGPAALASLREASRLAPGNGLLRMRYGLGLQAAGRHKEAVVLFRAAHKALPLDPAPLVNLVTSSIALNDPLTAVRAARRATLRSPSLPAAHYVLGQALLAADRPADAVKPLREAVRLAPGMPDAWVALGAAFYLIADMWRAEQATRQALAVDPAHEGAAANLGNFLRLTGRAVECEALLQTALARNPDASSVRTSLASDLMLRQRAADALALLSVPPPADRLQRAQWRLQQSLALILLGRPDEARLVLEAIRAEPLPPALIVLLRWRELLLAAPDERPRLAEETAALLDHTPAMLPEHRLMGWYDLARFWSDRQEPTHALSCWQKGHKLLARLQPFDRAMTAAWFDAMEQAFGAERLAHGPAAVNEDTAPIFIVGMPRSGTTLCEQILAAHPQAFGVGERAALQEAFTRLGGDETPEGVRRAAAAPQAALDDVAWAQLHALHALAPGSRRIVDKMPANFRLCGLISVLFPRARIIHCLRDPRDIGLSIFTFRFYGHHSYAHDLADLGWYITRERRLMAHWSAAMPGRILPVHLDEWVTDFDATLHRILAHIGLPWDDACTRFYESKTEVRTVSRNQVRQPVNDRGLGRWRLYAAGLKPLIDELEHAGVTPAD